MSRTAVIACGALAADVRKLARNRGWDLDVHPVPALLHNRPEQIPAAVAALALPLEVREDGNAGLERARDRKSAV